MSQIDIVIVPILIRLCVYRVNVNASVLFPCHVATTDHTKLKYRTGSQGCATSMTGNNVLAFCSEHAANERMK